MEMITCWQRDRSVARNENKDETTARRQVVYSVWHTALVCAALCLWQRRCEKRQQLYQGRTFISQRMFQPDGDCDYLSISERHLRLIESEDRVPPNDPDCFKLLWMTMSTDRNTGRNLHYVDAGQRIIRSRQKSLHGNARKTWVFLPLSSHEVRNARTGVQFISIPPHTFSDWPVI
jgi:hypothetical protein